MVHETLHEQRGRLGDDEQRHEVVHALHVCGVLARVPEPSGGQRCKKDRQRAIERRQRDLTRAQVVGPGVDKRVIQRKGNRGIGDALVYAVREHKVKHAAAFDLERHSRRAVFPLAAVVQADDLNGLAIVCTVQRAGASSDDAVNIRRYARLRDGGKENKAELSIVRLCADTARMDHHRAPALEAKRLNGECKTTIVLDNQVVDARCCRRDNSKGHCCNAREPRRAAPARTRSAPLKARRLRACRN